jgi:hypothetical protein
VFKVDNHGLLRREEGERRERRERESREADR